MVAGMTRSPSPPTLWLHGVLGIAIAACVAASTYMMPFVPDDSFISFRYAENIVRGHGLTFNPGEPPVEAYSNLLWILFCATLFQIGFDLPSFVPYAGLLLAVLGTWLLWLMLVRRGFSPLEIALPLLLLATAGPFIAYAISGLETPLYALLLLLTLNWIDLSAKRRMLVYDVLLALTGVLISLCRPEGIVVFPTAAVVLAWLSRRRPSESAEPIRWRNPIIAALVFVGLTTAYHVWRIGYFGEVLPTPFMSKGFGETSPLEAWGSNIRIYFQEQGDFYNPTGWYFLALAVAAVAGFRVSTSRVVLKRAESVAVALLIVHSAIYFNFKDWMPAMRYHAVLVGAMLLPAAHLPAVFFERRAAAPSPRAVRNYVAAGLVVLLLSFSVFADLKLVTDDIEESTQTCLVSVGKWLREVMPADYVLAMSDVGAVPYYSGLKTIDIHPQSLTDLHIAKKGFSREYVYDRRPEILILSSRGLLVEKFYPEHFAMAEDPRFFQTWRQLGASRYSWQFDRSYWIYVPADYPKIAKEYMDRFPQGVGPVIVKMDG
jgi:hypothetical protein